MRIRSLVISAMLIFAFALALSVIALATDPHVGVWKLNLAKSSYRLSMAPRSAMAKIEAQGNGVKLREDAIDAEGKASFAEFTAKLDGKDYPISGNASTDTVSITKPDANTWDEVLKKAGKVVIRSQNFISKDGKTMTRTIKVKDEKGQEIANVNIYDKQITPAADPFIGTWKMNSAKSKFSYPAPKSSTGTFTAQGNAQKITIDSVEADGKASHRSWISSLDGKDHPVEGNPFADMTSDKRVNPNTIEYVFKKNGKEVYRGRAVVSNDGMTMTDTGGGKDEKGQPFTYTIIMEKQ
jgi:hypothetical protein